jgi:hypothetical protein
LAQWFFWRRSWKCKSLQMDIWMTDNRTSEKLTWAFSSGELKSLRFWKPLRFLSTLWKLLYETIPLAPSPQNYSIAFVSFYGEVRATEKHPQFHDNI